jgi:hypothetical protein
MRTMASRSCGEVHYVEDGVVEQAYLALTGHPADVQAEIAALRGTLPCADLRQVLRRLRLSPAEDEQVELVRMLAVLGGEFYDNDVMHALADLLQSAETGARMQALLAVASLGWPTLRPLVTAAADSDEHAAVRQRAKEVLQAFDQIQRRGRAAVTPSRMDGPPS